MRKSLQCLIKLNILSPTFMKICIFIRPRFSRTKAAFVLLWVDARADASNCDKQKDSLTVLLSLKIFTLFADVL